MYKGKNILVFGLAKSGYSVAKLLSQDNTILVLDSKDEEKDKIEELKKLGVKFIKTDNPEDYLNEEFDVVIKNPGISPFHTLIKKAHSLNIPIVNELEVAYHYLKEDTTIIGITGSNGKTTTTTIVYEVLRRMKENVYLAGNIGYPLSSVVPTMANNSILVLEVSDHQLYDCKDFKTDISVLTNLCPTHLDFHGSYENYQKVKKKIFNNHTDKDVAIINGTNSDCLKLTSDIIGIKKYFNGSDAFYKDDYIYLNNEPLINVNDIKLKGIHNYENIMAALLVLQEFDLDKKILQEFLSEFNGVEHRIEFVAKINGVNFYNDSKSTNPTSTITALKTFNNNIHLILGGFERNQDFNELNDYLDNVKVIYAIGETRDRIKEWALKINKDCQVFDNLKEAMKTIKENVIENDIVLLSPASASWDQYKRFEDRGEEFKELVKEME